MGCDQEMMVLVSSYADGETTPEETARVKAHLQQCHVCRELLDEWNEQRHLFEWAYTVQTPQESSAEWEHAFDKMGDSMSIIQRISKHLNWIFNPKKLAWVGVFAILILISYSIYQVMILPPVFKTGTTVTTNNQAKLTRIGNRIQLNIGPYSIVRRIDDHTLRVQKGWVNASVEHGDNFRIQTKRMIVTDQGTRFSVGTGPQFDYVSLDHGYVNVTQDGQSTQMFAGRVYLAYDHQKPMIKSLLSDRVEDHFPGESFKSKAGPFVPQTDINIKQTEGFKYLASRFPNVRLDLSSRTSSFNDETSYTRIDAKGTRKALREHFTEVAQVLSGGRISHGDWEIPIGIIQINGQINQTEIPDDLYYIQLVPKDGSLVWRFNGSVGKIIDFPVSMLKLSNEHPIWGKTESIYDETGQHINEVIELSLPDWPGVYKPVLRKVLQFNQKSKNLSKEQILLGQINLKTRQIDDLKITSGLTNLLYLDPEQKHWFLIAWNEKAGEQLCRAYNSLRAGRQGTALLGVLMSDVPLLEPRVDQGIFLLKFVQPSQKQSPHLELVELSSLKTSALVKKTIQDNSGGYGWIPESLPGYGVMSLSYNPKPERRGGYPIQFQITGRPDDWSTRKIVKQTATGTETRFVNPSKVWVEGWVNVSAP